MTVADIVYKQQHTCLVLGMDIRNLYMFRVYAYNENNDSENNSCARSLVIIDVENLYITLWICSVVMTS